MLSRKRRSEPERLLVSEIGGECDAPERDRAMDQLTAEARQMDEREESEDAQERYTFACICGWRKTLHVDDLQAAYEKPFAPCGHPWECLECVG